MEHDMLIIGPGNGGMAARGYITMDWSGTITFHPLYFSLLDSLYTKTHQQNVCPTR